MNFSLRHFSLWSLVLVSSPPRCDSAIPSSHPMGTSQNFAVLIFNVKSFRCCLLTCVSCWLYLLQILFLLLPPISPNVGGSSSLQSLSARGNFRTKVTMNGMELWDCTSRRGCLFLRPYRFSSHFSSQLFST